MRNFKDKEEMIDEIKECIKNETRFARYSFEMASLALNDKDKKVLYPVHSLLNGMLEEDLAKIYEAFQLVDEFRSMGFKGFDEWLNFLKSKGG